MTRGNGKKNFLHKEDGKKKPRHTPASRKEATRRERERVQGIRLAFRSLQWTLKIPISGRPRYLHILQTAIERIRQLESQIGLIGRYDESAHSSSNEEDEKETKRENLYHIEGTINGTDRVYRNL